MERVTYSEYYEVSSSFVELCIEPNNAPLSLEDATIF